MGRSALRIFLSIILLGSVAWAAKVETPSDEIGKKMGLNPITLAEAKKLYDEGTLFVDVRKKHEYAPLHIKSAINAAYYDKGGNKNKIVDFDYSKEKYYNESLPADKSTIMVFYCSGKYCWKSFKAGVRSVKDGYTNIQWFRGGFPEWDAAGYPVE